MCVREEEVVGWGPRIKSTFRYGEREARKKKMFFNKPFNPEKWLSGVEVGGVKKKITTASEELKI